MTETEPSIENYKNEIEGNQSLMDGLLAEEELFSIPVVAETVPFNEESYSKADELNNELTVCSEEIENMEVIYEELDIDQPQKASEMETDEEFIINDLDNEVLDLEVVGSEEVKYEEENQFTFDFDLPITDTHEYSSKKIVHTLTHQEHEASDETSLSEAIDFKFEVVEKQETKLDLSDDELLSSPQEDSPFDNKIKETVTQKNEERKEHLKKFNYAFKHSLSKIDEFEKQPAYKRMGIELEQPSSSESNESRLSVDNDKNDEIQLRSNNSFLHDNVD